MEVFVGDNVVEFACENIDDWDHLKEKRDLRPRYSFCGFEEDLSTQRNQFDEQRDEILTTYLEQRLQLLEKCPLLGRELVTSKAILSSNVVLAEREELVNCGAKFQCA